MVESDDLKKQVKYEKELEQKNVKRIKLKNEIDKKLEVKKMDKENFELYGTLAFIVFIIGIIFLFFTISIVGYDEYAIEKEFGTLYSDVKDTGFTWVGFGSLISTNNQVRNYEIIVKGASSDYQDATLALNLNTKIKKESVYEFIKNYQTEETYQNYLNNKVQEKVKSILLKYSAEEILKNRLEISKELYNSVKMLPELDYFEFNDLVIKDVQFSEKFNEILEKKAQILIEREILVRQEENLNLLRKNTQIVDIDTYVKYQIVEKWDGKVPLIISDTFLVK
ncbi:MAG: SPFH domain-containing protein [archaeon]|nr:SPFH domain-containing protein [archaeon]